MAGVGSGGWGRGQGRRLTVPGSLSVGPQTLMTEAGLRCCVTDSSLSPRVSKENEGKGEPEEKRYVITNPPFHRKGEEGTCARPLCLLMGAPVCVCVAVSVYTCVHIHDVC